MYVRHQFDSFSDNKIMGWTSIEKKEDVKSVKISLIFFFAKVGLSLDLYFVQNQSKDHCDSKNMHTVVCVFNSLCLF